MDKEFSDMFNKNTDLLNQLIAMVGELTKWNTIEQDWRDPTDAMRILKIGERSLYRLRLCHPDQCRKVMGKWYYNITVLLVFKGKK